MLNRYCNVLSCACVDPICRLLVRFQSGGPPCFSDEDYIDFCLRVINGTLGPLNLSSMVALLHNASIDGSG